MLPLFSSFVKRTSDSVSSTAVANESISVAVVVVTKSSVSESNTTLSARHAIASIASSPSCSPLALNGSDFPSTESLSPPKSQIATSSTLFSCGFRLLQTLKSRIHRLTGSASTGIKGASDNQKRQIVRDHQVPSDPLTKAKQLFDQYLLANNPHLSNSSSCSSLSTTGDLDSLTDHSSLHIPDAHCRTSVPRPPAHSAPIPSNSTRPFPTNVTSGRRDSTSNDYHLGTTLERPTHRVVRLPPAKHYNHFQAPSHRHCRSSSRSGSSRSGSSTNEPFMPTISRTIVASPTCLKFSRLRFVRTAADHFRQAQSLLQLDFESFPTNERFVVNDPKSFCDLHSQSTGLKSNVDRTVIDRSRSWPDLQKTKQMSQIEQQQLQPLIEKKKTPKHESGATFASASVCGLPKLSFKCRLAHSNEMKSLSGFNTMVELYEKISKAFNLPINQVHIFFVLFLLLLEISFHFFLHCQSNTFQE